ncbi:MAG: hypothetical protein AAF483_05585 [Planctomycetota bacterium]
MQHCSPPIAGISFRICAAFLLSFVFASAVFGQEPGRQPAVQVQAGFAGYWKLGHVCPVRVRLTGSLETEARILQVFSVDGDGVEVVYTKPLEVGRASESWMPIRIGRKNYTIRIEVLGAAENVLFSGEIAPDSDKVLGSDQPFVIAIGDSMGLEKLSRTSADGSSSNFTCVTLTDCKDLPPSGMDLESCDLLVVSTSDPKLVQELISRWSTIDEYVRRGGGCVFSAATQSLELFQNSETAARTGTIQDFLPGKVIGKGRVTDPGVLESMLSTEERVREFDVVLYELSKGQIELSLSDSLNRSTPWWASFSHGHGTVRTIASDLGDPALLKWKDQRLLWQLIVKPYLDESMLENRSSEDDSGDSSYLGYRDLVGQLRATLDVFSQVQVVSFGQIAAILIGVILLVGPLDYFVSVRWLKRPDISWYFSSLVLVGTVVGLTFYCLQSRPNGVLVNTVQIFDFDVESGKRNGIVWSHVYSGNARRIEVSGEQRFGGQPIELNWQGLPGSGLGALSSQLSTDRGMPAYNIDFGGTGGSTIRNVGVAAGGTKCIVGRWTDQVTVESEFELSELTGVDQVQGVIQNPFDEDILNPVLFYHNWYYRLNSRIPAGGTISVSSDLVPKDIARKLNERKALNQKVSTTKWDPADRNSLDRLVELMMFHKAATGENYTSLQHRYQGYLDQSNLLDSDRAILVGSLKTPVASLQVNEANNADLEASQEVDKTWCRLIIPVEQPSN